MRPTHVGVDLRRVAGSLLSKPAFPEASLTTKANSYTPYHVVN